MNGVGLEGDLSIEGGVWSTSAWCMYDGKPHVWKTSEKRGVRPSSSVEGLMFKPLFENDFPAGYVTAKIYIIDKV